MKDTRKISELHNWEDNPRTITKKGLDRLKKQLTGLKQYKRLLILDDGTVIGGNMRLVAMRELGFESAKVELLKIIEKDGLFYGEVDGELSKPFKSKNELMIEYALSDNDRVGMYEGDGLANMIGNYPNVEWGDYSVDIKEPELISNLMDRYKEDIDFSDIEGMEDRKKEFRDIMVTCPHCERSFDIKV